GYALGIALERVAVSAAAGRPDHDVAALLDRMACDLSGRVEPLDRAVAIDPCADRDAGPATEHAKRRQQRAVRQQRVTSAPNQNAQRALHGKAAAACPGAS